jgi:hypothetical protein
LFNFGNADFAPMISWDVVPEEDFVMKSTVLKNFADSLYVLRRGGKQVNGIAKLAKQFGLNLDLVDILDTTPLASGLGGGGGT